MTRPALDGVGVIVTRPQHQSAELVAAIEADGGEVIAFPVIDIVGREATDIADDLRKMPPVDIAVFVSRNAVEHGFAAFSQSDTKIAAVGPATRDAIAALGGTPHIVPEEGFDSEHLLRHADLQDVRDKQIVIVRAQSGRELLADTLRERGAKVENLCVYQRKRHEPSAVESENLASRLHAGGARFVIVMSVDSCKFLLQNLPSDCLDHLRKLTLVAPSARVIQTASELIPGIRTELAGGPQAPDIVGTLVSLAQSGKVQ